MLVPRLISGGGWAGRRCSVCPAACPERPWAGRLGEAAARCPCCPTSPGRTGPLLWHKGRHWVPVAAGPQRGATGSLIQGPFSLWCSGKMWCLQALIAREAEGQERALRLIAALGGVTEHLLWAGRPAPKRSMWVLLTTSSQPSGTDRRACSGQIHPEEYTVLLPLATWRPAHASLRGPPLSSRASWLPSPGLSAETKPALSCSWPPS